MESPHDGSFEADVERFAAAAEKYLGKRFGGFWIDRSYAVPCLTVAVVGPTQEDVEKLLQEREHLDSPIQVIAVRYSWQEVTGFFERIPSDLFSESFLSLGASPITNRMELELNRADPEFVERILEFLPRDALGVSILPGFSWEAASEP